MKISTKGRYGLRAMVDLTLNSKGEYVTLNSIAERQDVSEKYLEQVFSILRKAGLVKSIKGAQGGYMLGDDSDKITVGDILRALEGSLSVTPVTENDNSFGNIMDKYLDREIWDKVNKEINEIVDSITLDLLVGEYRKIVEASSLLYYI